MRHLGCLTLALLALTLSACKTVSIHHSVKQAFAISPNENNGAIRITSFHIQKSEPGTTFLLVLAAMGGANINYPISGSVFDVTDEVRYLGTLGVYTFGDWLEMEATPGRHVLMLTLGGGKLGIVGDSIGQDHSDFIEVDVRPGAVTHLVLSRYGFARYPYLGEVVISDEHRERCLNLTGARNERLQSVRQYMSDSGINQHASDFSSFCFLLSEPKRIHTPDTDAQRRFSQVRARIETIRNDNYEKWKVGTEKRGPYDLMRVYEPVAKDGLW